MHTVIDEQRQPSTPPARRLRRLRWWRRGIAALVALMGIGNIVSSLVVRIAARSDIVHALFPLEIVHGTRHAAVVAGFGLLLISRGLWRGKRPSWIIAIGLLAGSAVFHLLKGLDWEEASAALVLIAVLVWRRNMFRAPADRPTLQRTLAALLGGGSIIMGYALLGSVLLSGQFTSPPTPGATMSELAARLQLDVGPLQPNSRRGVWFVESFSVIGVALAAYAIWALLRPLIAAPASISERVQARALLERWSTSSLAPFALGHDKSLFWSAHVDGLISYRVAREVAVVCGDPLVDPRNLPLLLDEWLDHCTDRGWESCFYEVSADHLAAYEAVGLRTIKIGEDAWIDLGAFSLKGKPIADIRHAVSKIERDGVRFEVLTPETPGGADLWQQLHTLAAVHDRGEWELGFSIGRLPAVPDPTARYTGAIGSDGTLLAGCAWLALPGANGWALDVMLRHDAAPNGTMEYLIAQALLHFQQTGAAWASLGVAPLADADVNHDDRSLLQRGVRLLYEHPRINELYRYKSLFFFKRKFVPQWRGVFLVYESQVALPRTLFAVLNVHLPVIQASLITEFLISQGERNLHHWRAWLQHAHNRGERERC